jgi:hypothetical protein
MQPHPDDHIDEPTEQAAPDHSIPVDMHPVLKPSKTALGQVDAAFVSPDGTRIYVVEVKRWAMPRSGRPPSRTPKTSPKRSTRPRWGSPANQTTNAPPVPTVTAR